ncbi:hypothetical protein AJ80_06496 [Polytolypa hystricis UAMH7299]|uniref:Nab2-like CCCH zinc finger domain-containing protein n=1 Tax=Polytolypa hystricis (strain UAMH7299) TaxID=1447883 RepID=A0A2B7XWL0_POLH7|nr:hypothetical protein AJ80_06496 [Polytolypa hystricis UAMH7299]
MGVSVQLNTPLAEALNEVVQPKLVEVGWSTGGGDDSALAEYVILMLVNGKTQEQIAAELSNDLLGLGPDDTDAIDFSKWLFEQVETLNNRINGAQSEPTQQETPHAIPSFSDTQDDAIPAGNQESGHDAEMGDATTPAQDFGTPTGPRSARSPRQNGRGRLMGQLSKAMDRTNDSVLHRVRNQRGSERIGTHREPPKGPRNFQFRNGRMGPGRPTGMGMGMGMGMGGPPNQNIQPGPGMMPLTPQQQMQMMAMFEEQARMMSQLMPGMVPPAINPAFQNGPPQHQHQGRSLFDRAEHRGQNFNQRGNQNGTFGRHGQQDADMGNSGASEEKPSMDVDGGDQTQSSEPPGPDSVCRFNLRCTRKDCPYAHQSPAAPEGTPVDVTDHCPFGAACKNRKCAARHPSPSQKAAHQSEEICRFFPHCANPRCTFQHPSMPMCRNGADCTVSGCKFTHLQVPCKFNPCLNRTCPYKHVEGQKGVFADKVWTAGEEGTHVSERKFVDENAEEELIKPGATQDSNQDAQKDEIIT